MILSFHPCITADHQIILGHRPPDSDDRRFISQADLVILPQTCPEKLFLMCVESGVSIFPDYRARFDYPGKVGQNRLFKKTELPHPDTMEWDSIDHFLLTVEKEQLLHKYPFLIKEDRRHEGEGIHLIQEKNDIEPAINKIIKRENCRDIPFISQEYINSDGNALRVVIIEDLYISYWKRPGVPGQEISTISNGAIVDKKWMPELQKKGIKEAEKLSLKTGINLAAVDFIFNLKDPDPEPLFLEINYSFGRTGLGGTLNYYNLLFKAVTAWMDKNGFNSTKVKLV